MEENVVERRHRQIQEARELANKTRKVQGELTRRMRAGELDAVLLLEGKLEPWSSIARAMRLGRLLDAVPRLGNGTIRAIIHEARMFPDDRWRDATPPQAERILMLVRMVLERE